MTDTLHMTTDINRSSDIANLLKQGRLDEAEVSCVQLINDSPGNAEAYFQLSLVCMQRKAWQRTLDLLETATGLNPNVAIYHANRGASLFMLKQYQQAVDALTRALILDPDHINALNNLGVVYSLQGKNVEAEKLLKHSLKLDPKQPEAWLNLCSAVQELDFREEDVVGYARQAVSLQPRNPTPYMYLGKALLRQGAPLAALEAMKTAALLDSRNADIHYRIGVCQLELEQIPEAILSFQHALAINPQHDETYLTLADFLYKIEDFSAAEEAARQALALTTNHKITAQRLLAKILFTVGKYDEAKEHHQNQQAAFNALHRLTPANDKAIVAPVQSIDAWSTRLDQPMRVVLPERDWHSEEPLFYGSHPQGVVYTPVTIPRVYVAEIPDAVILPGHEVILVEHEKIALYDRLVLMKDWHSLREDETVPLISNDHILVDAKPKAKKKIKQGIFLMSEAWYNYAHWLSEQLPRVFLLEQIPEYMGIPILVNEGLYPQQLEALKMTTQGRYPIKILDRGKRHEVERLIYPSILSAYNKRRYRPDERATPADGAFHPEAIHFLRNRLLPQCRNDSGARKRLWISRGQQLKVGQRRMLNEPELESLFLEHGFEVAIPEAMSFAEQVELFSQAEMIVGPGGSALMNMVFAPVGAKILILTKNHPQVNFHYFTNIAQIIGQSIAYVCGESVKNMGVLGYETDFLVDIKEAKHALRDFFRLA